MPCYRAVYPPEPEVRVSEFKRQLVDLFDPAAVLLNWPMSSSRLLRRSVPGSSSPIATKADAMMERPAPSARNSTVFAVR